MHSYSPPAEFVRPVASGRGEKTKQTSKYAKPPVSGVRWGAEKMVVVS